MQFIKNHLLVSYAYTEQAFGKCDPLYDMKKKY